MFNDLPQDFLSIIVYLLPGFLCAWVYYGLTSHPKPVQFERIVQALIFTFIIRAVLIPVKFLLLWIGDVWFILSEWNSSTESLLSLFLALFFGLVFAYVVNTDSLYKLLRKIGFTSRTSHPSEWFYIFSQKVTFVILQLSDGRRLYGWPKEWPIESNKGQFYIMLPAWIKDDGELIELPQLDGVLIQVSDVKWVEFINVTGE